MATGRLNTVIEQTLDGSYFIYDPDGGQQVFALDSPEWFLWLAGRSSFHFEGTRGHFTARQEKKQRGVTYWYAYVKAYNRRHKHYLGTTHKVTMAKLEEAAQALHDAALGAISEDEDLNIKQQKSTPLTSQELAVSSLMFRWHDDVLMIKTPTETHYLNNSQATEVLGYLYTLRKAIMNKRE